MIVRFWIILFLFLGLVPEITYSQPTVLLLQNPSFEDEPGFSRTPRGWFYCGEMGETPPDIHPHDAMFGVVHEAKSGYTYIGMVVRDNNTWEGVSQWLPESMQAGQCYEFSLYTARSPYYQSISRTTWQLVNFDRPVILRLWGGNLNCEKKELLAVSPLIESTDWQHYTFHFQPLMPHNRLVIEAYYAPDAAPYSGNVLIDAVSPILPVHCESGEPAVDLETISLESNVSADEIATLSRQITFSEEDKQLEQHAFYLPSGEIYQANKPLYILSQMLKITPDRKLIFYLREDNKRLFKVKSESLERELFLYGLSLRQFRIMKYRPRKADRNLAIEVLVEVQ